MMRNSILSLGICALLANAVHAQSYKPFITPGKQFTIYYEDPTKSSIYGLVHYFFDGDSLLKDGKIYTKLYGRTFGFGPLTPTHETFLSGLLYEDLAGQKVHLYPQGIWMDFSLQKGDSAISGYFPWITWKEYVDTIVRITLSNGDTVRQFRNPNGSIIYTESVYSGEGNPGKFIGIPHTICNWDANKNLIYHFERNNLGWNCDTSYYIGLKENISNTVEITFSNPVNKHLTINSSARGSFTLINLLGNPVYTNAFDKGKNNIDLPTLSNGEYVISFHFQDQQFYDKLIIQH